jgi:two-component system cell cycle response regulator DivK
MTHASLSMTLEMQLRTLDGVPRHASCLEERQASKSGQILVVDDNELFGQYVNRLLTREGYSCLSACNSTEAFELLEEHKPVLVLLDIELPGMSGPELSWRIKCSRPEIHIAAISGRYEIWEPDDLRDLGFERLFGKPLMLEELLRYCMRVDGSLDSDLAMAE